MENHLSGQSQMYDAVNKVILRGEITLISDGKGRSEIIISDPESGRTEDLVFTARATWIPVHHLILAIQDIHRGESVEIFATNKDVCEMCGGLGFYEDEDGNWPDCALCVSDHDQCHLG